MRLFVWPLGGLWALSGILGFIGFLLAPAEVFARFTTSGLILIAVHNLVLAGLGIALIYVGAIAVRDRQRAGTTAQATAWAAAGGHAFNILRSMMTMRDSSSTGAGSTSVVGQMTGAIFGFALVAGIYAAGTWLLDQSSSESTSNSNSS